MPKLKIRLTKMLQDRQDLGSDDDHMVSRVLFSITDEGGHATESYADVKQLVGAPYAEDAIEVGRPVGYRGPFNHEAFSAAVRKYVLSAVGPTASGIRVTGSAQVRMRANTFMCDHDFTIDTGAGDGGW